MLAFIDAFGPTPKTQDPVLLIQTRTVIGASFLTILAGISFLLLQMVYEIPSSAMPHVFFTLLGCSVLLMLKLGVPVVALANLQSGGFLGYLLWAAAISGGVETYILPGFMVMPLTAVFMGGKLWGGLWSGATLLGILGLAVVRPEAAQSMTTEAHYSMLTAAGLLATFAISVLAIIMEVTKSLSYADLTIERARAESSSERVKELLRNLSHTLNKVNNDSTEIARKARSTSGSMQAQSQGADSLFESMSALRQRIAENARQSNEVADSALALGENVAATGQMMSRTTTDMTNVGSMLLSAASQIEELNRRSEEITSIVEVIQSVAEQTNLLALNAAIEAARAGEHGRGFAVVADEVRGLAERTHNSTGEISHQISGIVSVTQEAMDAMSRATALMQTGKENADSADEALQGVVVSANDVADFLKTLAADSEQQRAMNDNMTAQFETIRKAISEAYTATSNITDTIAGLEGELSQMTDSANRFNQVT